jgi:hypothetical protein
LAAGDGGAVWVVFNNDGGGAPAPRRRQGALQRGPRPPPSLQLRRATAEDGVRRRMARAKVAARFVDKMLTTGCLYRGKHPSCGGWIP